MSEFVTDGDEELPPSRARARPMAPSPCSAAACPVSGQTPGEEVVNALIHGVGFFLAIVALFALMLTHGISGDFGRALGSGIFGTTLVLLYGASTLYHAARAPTRKRVLQIVDHACVYALIAGTYTPFTLVTLEGPWGWSLLSVVWALCAVGIVLKIFFIGRFELISTLVYLGMGWLIVVAIGPLWRNLDGGGLALLIAGGLSYTAGTLFFLRDRRNRYFHAIWHIFVLAGSTFHTLAVLFYLARPAGG